MGLDYLSLSRATGTLSGGEAQRIRLATQIGSGLVGVAYILDEPSIGLHQRDNDKLLNTLKNLKDLGNTLIVVEHDEDTMLAADYVVDIGPGAVSTVEKWLPPARQKRSCRMKNPYRSLSEWQNTDTGARGTQKTNRISDDQRGKRK